MDIGIVTVYNNLNYGSKLQSYALHTILRKLGHNLENIPLNNIRKGCIRNLQLFAKDSKLHFISLFHPNALTRNLAKQRYAFRKFQLKYLKEGCYSPSEIKQKIESGSKVYDRYICGSDQIWAPNQFREDFFLGFVQDKDIKISYATSIGLPKIPANLIENYKNLVSNIGHVSLREHQGSELLKNITGKNYSSVIINTEKGRTLLSLLEQSMFIYYSNFQELRRYNPIFFSSTPSNPKRNDFFLRWKAGESILEIAKELGGYRVKRKEERSLLSSIIGACKSMATRGIVLINNILDTIE